MLNPRLLVVLAASWSLPACHLIKVNGKPLGSSDTSAPENKASGTATKESPKRQQAVQPPPTKSAKRGVAVTVGQGFGPNPLIVAGVGGKHDQSVFKMHKNHRWNHCTGDTTKHPTVVLTVDADTEQLRLTGPPGSTLFAVRQGRVMCESVRTTSAKPVLNLKGWDGKVEVWVAREGVVRLSANPRVVIEDFARPRSAPWLDKAKPMKLKEAPKKPTLLDFDIPAVGKTPAGVLACRDARFRADPDLVLRFDRPITNLSIVARSFGHANLLLMGPIPDDRRKIPASCMGHGQVRKRLEPGLYALKIGTGGTPAPVTLVLSHTEAKLDPLVLAKRIPEGLTIKQRRLAFHFPMLNKKHFAKSDTMRRSLFLRAPASLFVFPKYDLDDEKAGVDHSTAQGRKKNARLSFPRAGEPLLLLGGSRYLSADGGVFVIKAADLQTTAPKPVVVPNSARNPGLRYSDSVAFARSSGTKAEKRVVASMGRAYQKSERCKERIWRPQARKIEALEQGPYSAARSRRIASIERNTRERAYTQCVAPYNRTEAAGHARLIKLRTERRNRSLRTVRERLKSLF